MTDRASCLEDATPPALKVGAERRDGKYWRNLEPDAVTKRYGKDLDDEPRFGWRLRPNKWYWRDREGQEGLSVSATDCTGALCSILFHPTPEKFAHAVAIDLAAFSFELGMEVVAVYSPVVTAPENPCHFDLMPADQALEDLLVQLKDFLQRVYPSTFPATPADIEQALAARAKYETCFSIKRSVQQRI